MAGGVGYTPSTLVSQYMLDNLGTAYLRHVMDLSEDPGKVGAVPNEHFLNFSDPAVRDAFERRYGPYTASSRHKRWIGPGNEVRHVLADALSWKYGGGAARPTQVEITDVQATGDRLWYEYLVEVVQTGFSLDHPEHISDPSKPHGPVLDERGRTPKHPFWNVPYYQFNDAAPAIDPPPPPPPVDDDPPPVVIPPPTLSDPAVRAEELASLAAPVYDAIRNRSFFTRRLPSWAELWPIAKPLAVELVKSVRRTSGRVR